MQIARGKFELAERFGEVKRQIPETSREGRQLREELDTWRTDFEEVIKTPNDPDWNYYYTENLELLKESVRNVWNPRVPEGSTVGSASQVTSRSPDY